MAGSGSGWNEDAGTGFTNNEWKTRGRAHETRTIAGRCGCSRRRSAPRFHGRFLRTFREIGLPAGRPTTQAADSRSTRSAVGAHRRVRAGRAAGDAGRRLWDGDPTDTRDAVRSCATP